MSGLALYKAFSHSFRVHDRNAQASHNIMFPRLSGVISFLKLPVVNMDYELSPIDLLLWWAWQIGKSKVFLRAGQMADLDTRRAEVLGNAARKIQRHARTYIARREFISVRNAAIQIQSWCRGMHFV